MGSARNSKVVIAGSSGVIGSALVAALRADDHTVVRLVRRDPISPDEHRWDPVTGHIDPGVLEGADALVNMCGAGVGDKRWSGAYKQELYDSRIGPTEVLAGAAVDARVPVLLNASAVGYYGDTGDRVVDETGANGAGFLAHLCRDWEAATEDAETGGVRVVMARTGLVLSPTGGLFGKVRPLFLAGLGARLGNGRQYLPWISFEDVLSALKFALFNTDISGPVNITGPAPVTNAEFTAAMGKTLGRPSFLVAPGFALRLAFSDFADEAMMQGQRAIPGVLEAAGFEFAHHTIGEALAYANNSRPLQ